MHRLFKILDIDGSIPHDEVKKIYKNKVKKVHPDHGGIKEEFIDLQTAYQEYLLEVGELNEHDLVNLTIQGVIGTCLDNYMKPELIIDWLVKFFNDRVKDFDMQIANNRNIIKYLDDSLRHISLITNSDFINNVLDSSIKDRVERSENNIANSQFKKKINIACLTLIEGINKKVLV